MRRYRLLKPVLGLAVDDDRGKQVVDPEIVALCQRERIDLSTQKQARAIVEGRANCPRSGAHALLLNLQQQMLELSHIEKAEEGKQQQDARSQEQLQPQARSAKTSGRHASDSPCRRRFLWNRMCHRAR